MLRIRDISIAPEHDKSVLLYEASRILGVSASEIRSLQLVRRSIDARKKPQVRVIYTVDVALKGSENKVLKRCRSSRVSPAPVNRYRIPAAQPGGERPVVIGFGPAGMFAALCWPLPDAGRLFWSGERMPLPGTGRWKHFLKPESWIPGATCSLGKAVREPSPMGN